MGQLGREADVIFQICCQCLMAHEIHPPAIMSAFTLSSVLGYVFIEAFNIREARHAVKGLVTVRDKQPRVILPTEYIGILSSQPHSSAWIEVRQWVRCIAGQYRDDVGYVYQSNVSKSNQWEGM